MISETPKLGSDLRSRLEELDGIRATLGHETGRRAPWIGPLRRQVRASAFEGSTSIEGFSVAPGEAVALVGGEEPVDPGDASRMAVSCYARAMDHVGAMAGDPAFRWLDRVILDLHFDACSFQRDADPGRWRTGGVGVTGSDGRFVYRAPDADDVPALMAETVEWLEHGDLDSHAVVRAAMAHLHVVSIHPFRDGNGRVSRLLLLLQCYHLGFEVGRYISIERLIEEKRRNMV